MTVGGPLIINTHVNEACSFFFEHALWKKSLFDLE